MKVRAGEKNFNFPYLYDGETEVAARRYGPVSTPHIFIFDKNRICGTMVVWMTWKTPAKHLILRCNKCD